MIFFAEHIVHHTFVNQNRLRSGGGVGISSAPGQAFLTGIAGRMQCVLPGKVRPGAL